MSDLSKYIDNYYQVNAISFVLKEPGEDRFTDHVHRSIFTASTPVQDQTTNSSSSGPSSKAVTVTELPAHENVKNDVPEKATGENKLLFLLFLLFAFPIIGIAVFCCKRRKSRKPEKKDARKVEQTCPLMSRRSRKLLIKVARYSFSGSIPLKFEHKLRRQKQSFGKIATTVVLDKDENLL